MAIAVAISACLMLGMTARAVVADASCSNSPLYVNVAASNDIAAAIQDDASAFNAQNPKAAGRCIQVEVNAGDSASLAGQIDGQTPLAGRKPIDAWIPDSTLWVDVARSYPVGAQVVQPTGNSVARSPLMMVTTSAVAAQTHVFDSPPGWSLLLPPSYGGPPAGLGLGVDLPDPSHNASGLATLIQVGRQLGLSQAAGTAFTKFVFTAQATENFDSASALQSFVDTTLPPLGRRAVTVASEQAVLAYDRANPHSPLAARYATGARSTLGTPELDYPYVLTTSGTADLAAATEFGNYLRTTTAQSVARYFGFRSVDGRPDAMPASAGLNSQVLQLASAPSAGEAASSLQVWRKLGLGSRDLTLIDVSAAMNAPVGNGTLTVEQVLTQTSALGLALFPDSTHMGLWEMGMTRSAAQNYQQLVPVGPLPAEFGLITRRYQLRQITETLHATATGTLALNDVILAAYQQMTSTYAPNYANAVLVLTAGIDNAPGDMALNSLLNHLRSLYNPAKKVEIVILMFGNHGNFTAMREIAAATGGVAYQISNPAEIGKVFIEAIAHRMCTQGCIAP